MTFLKRLLLAWAEWRGDDLTALKLSKEIVMADWTKIDATIDRVIAKDAASGAAVAAAQQSELNMQSEIDARDAKLSAIAPLPAETIGV